MISYILRRLLLLPPTLLGVTFLVFFVMALAPGGIGGPLLNKEGALQGEEARRVREYYQKRYGLDKPAVVQYARWLNQISPLGWTVDDQGHYGSLTLKWPNLGESLARHRPVVDLIRESLPITLLLNLVSLPLIYAIGILSGLYAAWRRGGVFDVSSGAVYLALWSIPTIWAGVMLIGLLANKQYLHLFPTAGLESMTAADMPFLPHWTTASAGSLPSGSAPGSAGGYIPSPGIAFQPGYLLDLLWHLVLPIVCLSYGGFAYLSKLTRGSILDNLASDFVRTARAKGVPERDILFRHVFRNSLLSLITVAAGIIPALFAGSIVVETIFSIPGMGRLSVQAVQFRDRELVLAVTLVGGLISLLSELLRDVCYAMADPRVSYE
ncbi:MAG: ABC transporter permease [Phycisphaeraceae bacterium]|nr:ABC transporter permease [Phycisphaeraceae bacterium]